MKNLSSILVTIDRINGEFYGASIIVATETMSYHHHINNEAEAVNKMIQLLNLGGEIVHEFDSPYYNSITVRVQLGW